MVAEGTGLGGAPSRSGNRIPVWSQFGLAGAAGSRIHVHDGARIAQPRQRHQTTIGRLQSDVWNERTHKMRRGALVDRLEAGMDPSAWPLGSSASHYRVPSKSKTELSLLTS